MVVALAHVPPLRDYFLSLELTTASPLVRKFSRLIRQIWSAERFKSGVDPHSFVNAVAVESGGRFVIGKQGEAGEFLSWLLDKLNRGLGGGKKSKKKARKETIVQKLFGGKVRITTTSKKKNEEAAKDDDDGREGSGNEDEGNEMDRKGHEEEVEEVTEITETNFLQLSLDVPQKPLFKEDDAAGVVVPQEPISKVLDKFSGDLIESSVRGNRVLRSYSIFEMPPYLILHLHRFKKNDFFVEKNVTIITFPIAGLDLSPYFKPSGNVLSEGDLREGKIGVKEMRLFLEAQGKGDLLRGGMEKQEQDLVDACVEVSRSAKR